MSASIQLDPQNGAAVITPTTALPKGQPLRFALRDMKTRRYLTASGWASSRKTLIEITPDTETVQLKIDAPIAALVAPGTPLLLEEIFIGLRERLTWPKAPAAPEITPVIPAVAPTASPVEPPAVAVAVQPDKAAHVQADWREVDAQAAVPITLMPRRRAAWMAGGIGLMMGAILLLAFIRLSPAGAGLFLPQTSRPSPELLAREAAVDQREQSVQSRAADLVKQQQAIGATETALANREATLQVTERTAGADAKALRAERDQLQARLQTAEQALGKANLRLTIQPGSAAASGELLQLRDLVADLRKQLDDVKLDRSMDVARVKEQEKVIASRDSQIRTLQAQLGDSRMTPVPGLGANPNAALEADLQDANRVLDDLRQENLQLQGRLQDQSKTISAWAVDRTAAANRIRELEQQLALRVSTTQNLTVQSAAGSEASSAGIFWLAAAVNAAGSVEVVTGFDNEEAAKAAVMQKCRQSRRTCDLLGTYRNMCFSVARPRGQAIMEANYWFQPGQNRADAQRAAVMDCDRNSGAYCATAFTVCASDN